MADSIWPFLPGASPIEVVGMSGSTLHTADGREILDAAGGAVVANIGHGRREVLEAMAQAESANGYVVPTFLTPSRRALTERLQRDWLPASLQRVHVTCGGSEGVESALQIALRYQQAVGRTNRTKIIGRDVSYHGTTLASAGVGGHEARKAGLYGALPDWPKVSTPYALRPPGDGAGTTAEWFAAELEGRIEAEGADTIAAFIGEPVTGTSGGALVPPEGYWQAITDVCRRHGVLVIADEVMTGFGRLGHRFGCEAFGIDADIVVGGKVWAGGYAAITGVFSRPEIAEAIREAGLPVMFHTFGALPGACAASDTVLRIMDEEQLIPRATRMGDVLQDLLDQELGEHPNVAQCRGMGLLRAVEIVRDRETLEPFPESARITDRVVGHGIANGVFFYPGGTGVVRDIVAFGPPYVVTESELERMVKALRITLDEVCA